MWIQVAGDKAHYWDCYGHGKEDGYHKSWYFMTSRLLFTVQGRPKATHAVLSLVLK